MKYIWNNSEYTQDEIDQAASSTGLSIDQYLIDNKIEAIEDEEVDGEPKKSKRKERKETKKNIKEFKAKDEKIGEFPKAPEPIPTIAELEEEAGAVEVDLTPPGVEAPTVAEDIVEENETEDPFDLGNFKIEPRKFLFNKKPKIPFSELTIEDFYKDKDKVKESILNYDKVSNISFINEMEDEDVESMFKTMDVETYYKENGKWYVLYKGLGKPTEVTAVIGGEKDNIQTRLTDQPDLSYALEQEDPNAQINKEREASQMYKDAEQQVNDIAIEIEEVNAQMKTLKDNPAELTLLNDKLLLLQKEQNDIYDDLNLQLTTRDTEKFTDKIKARALILAAPTEGGFKPKISLNKQLTDYTLPESDQTNTESLTTPAFPYMTVSQEQEDEYVLQSKELYDEATAALFNNASFDFLNQKTYIGRDEENNPMYYNYSSLFDIEDFRNAPMELIQNLKDAPTEVLYNLFNIPKGYEMTGDNSAFEASTLPYRSAELFNKIYGPFGFYAYYDEDSGASLKRGIISQKGDGARVRIYYQPDFEELVNKDGTPINVSELDKYKSIAIPKGAYTRDDQPHVELLISEENPYSSQTPGFLDDPTQIFRVDSELRLDNTYENFAGSATSRMDQAMIKKEMRAQAQSYDNLIDFMENAVALDMSKNNGRPFIDMDMLDVAEAPTMPLVQAAVSKLKTNKENLVQLNANTDILEAEILEISENLKQYTPTIQNYNQASINLQDNQVYQSNANKTRSAYKEASDIVTRLNEIADILNNADKPLPTWFTTNPVTGEVLRQEYSRLDNQLNGMKDGLQDLEGALRKDEKDFLKAKKKYDRLDRRILKDKEVDLKTYYQQEIEKGKNINVKYNALVTNKLAVLQKLDDIQDSLDVAEVKNNQFIASTAGRGNFGSYTWNRITSSVKDSFTGLAVYATEMAELMDKNFGDTINYDADAWGAVKYNLRKGAEVRYNNLFKKHDIDAFYTSNFDQSEWGQVYGVGLDMVTDMALGWAVMPFAPGLGFSLASSGRIMAGLDSEIDQLLQDSKYVKDSEGNTVYDSNTGEAIIAEGWEDKALSLEEKIGYKTLVGGGTAILEKVGLGTITNFGKSKLAQSIVGKMLSALPKGAKINPYKFTNMFKIEVKNLIAKGVFVTTVGVGGEVTTEVAQEYWGEMSKGIVNGWRNSEKIKFFSDPDLVSAEMQKRVANVAKITTYATIPFSLLGKGSSAIATQSRTNRSKNQIAAALNIVKNAETKKNYFTELDLAVKNNKMKQEDADLQKEYILRLEGIAQGMPTDSNGEITISTKAQTDIAFLQSQIIDLKQNKSEKSAADKNKNNKIKELELQIEAIVDEDLENGGAKAEAALRFRQEQEQKRVQKNIDAIRQKNLQKSIDKQGNIVIDASNQNRIREEIKKIEEETGIKIDPSQYELSEENKENFKVVVFTEENSAAIAEEYGLDPEQLIDEETGKFSSEGIYISSKGVILMDVNAAEGVLQHESVHNLLDIALNKKGNENIVFGLARSLMKEMVKIDPRASLAIAKQMEKYDSDPNYNAAQVAEELLTYYAQLKSQGRFKSKGNKFVNAASRQIRRLFENLGVPIEINTQNVMEFLDDYLYSMEKGGKFTEAQKAVMRGDISFTENLIEDSNLAADTVAESEAEADAEIETAEELETPSRPAEQEVVVAEEIASTPVVEAKKISDELDIFTGAAENLKYSDIKKWKRSADYAMALEAMTSPDSNLLTGSIEAMAAKYGVEKIDVQAVKDRLYEKYLGIGKKEIKLKEGEIRGYDPTRNSLFGWLLGKNGNLNFAVLDTIRDAVAKPSGPSLDAEVFEGGPTFEQEDQDINIIEEIDNKQKAESAPTSRTRRDIIVQGERGLSEEVVKDLKNEITEIEKTLLPVTDPKYRTDLEKKSGRALKPLLAKAFGISNKANYTKFIEDNFELLNQLDIKYLLELDKGLVKQGKPRKFTRLNKKLTTQEEIRKYRDSGDIYVENEAQGVNLYDRLKVSEEDVKDFYLNQTASNVTNRKGKLIEAFGNKFFKDFLPQIQREADVKPQQRATTAAKIQRPQNLKFSKKFDQTLIDVSVLPNKNKLASKLGFLSPAINESNRKSLQDRMEKAAERGYLDTTVIEAGNMGSGGRLTVYGDFKDGKFVRDPKSLKKWVKLTTGEYILFAEGITLDSGKVVFKQNDTIKNELAKHDNYVARPGRLYYGNEDPRYLELIKKAKDNKIEVTYVDSKGRTKTTSGGRINIPPSGVLTEEYLSRPDVIAKQEANMKTLEHVIKKLADSRARGMSMDIAGDIIIQSYQATDGLVKITAPYKYVSKEFNYGPPDSKSQQREGKKYREEHNPPASVVGASILAAIQANKASDIIKYIKQNYYQTQLSKFDDSKIDKAKLDSTLVEGTSIANNPITRLSESKINLNTLIDPFTKRSIIEDYGLGVPSSFQSLPNVFGFQNKLVREVEIEGKDLNVAKKELDIYVNKLALIQEAATKQTTSELNDSGVLYTESKEMDIEELLSKAAGIDEALKKANMLDQPIKKIRIFDFDDTLATSNNIVLATRDNEVIKLNAEQFANEGADLKAEGWEMDFSDFNNVTDGGRGPLFDIAKKIKQARGNEDLYVLTARSPEAQQAIYDFLKAEGLEFKKENIVGLGNSTGEAKANWIIDKAADGFNDFYFADDAYQNVKAVQDALGVIDVKSKVQQAIIKESKKLDEEFNKLLEETTDTEFYKEYSSAKAKTIGSNKGKFKFFIPYSAEDFLGLIYPTLSKGAVGDSQMAWYKKNILDPYTKAQENISAARVNLMNDFKALKKSLNVPKNLRKKNSSGFTNEQAVRVYLFNKQGHNIPGMSKRDLKELNDIVANDPELKLFADQILTITKGDGYFKPDKNWLVGTITTDLIGLLNTVKRPKYLAEWQQRVDVVYSEKNLNKLEALYGTKYREALENILARMKSGKNRLTTGNRLSNRVLDYINGSIGTIMFFNTRSAVLQTLSSINFINWSFNNPVKAGAAFANQPQYWKDFTMLMNSDYLRDRRNGLRLNISESEIADAAATSKNKAKAVLSYILEKGFLPTQYADSFAIASGGATFYRNRVNDLIKNEGKTQAEAEAQALIEFRQNAEKSQQSSDPSKISAQQSSDLGRLILAFANTPMQYARLQKRAIQDLANGRGDAKANVSKIAYYGFVQNLIFNALQQGVFALGFGDDDDDGGEERYMDTANGMLDSILRGLGIGGQAVSVGKNFLLDIYERSGRSRPEYVDSIYKLLQFSPPISSKISKLRQAAWQFDSKKRRKEMFDKGFSLDNPAYDAFAKVMSATTNIPLDRLLYKMDNIKGALEEDNDTWQRIAMLAGWPEWVLKPRKDYSKSKKSVIDKRKKVRIGGPIIKKKKKIRLK